jgi:hypothetical protein
MKLPGRTKVAWVILDTFCVCAAFLALVFNKTLFQEGNPLRLAVGIGSAYFTDTGIGRIPGDPEKYIKRSGRDPDFWLFMESQGWTAVDQWGSLLILENETKGLFVGARMWTRHFQVFEIVKTVDKATDRSYNWSRERDFFPTKASSARGVPRR